jgi:hypothetical protein
MAPWLATSKRQLIEYVLSHPFNLTLQVLRDTSCGEVWKLQFVELLLQDWLLLPQQAVQLLNMFDRWGRSTQGLAAE